MASPRLCREFLGFFSPRISLASHLFFSHRLSTHSTYPSRSRLVAHSFAIAHDLRAATLLKNGASVRSKPFQFVISHTDQIHSLFITPVEPDTVTKSPERMAAISRSTIRRRPVTRPRNTVNYVRRRLPGSLEYDGEDVSQSWGEPTRQSADREYIDTASLRSAGLPRGLENERSGDVENMASSRSARESTLQELSSRSASRENRTRAIYRAERSAREQSRSRLGRRHAAPTPPYHDNESDIYEHSILPPPRRISVMTPTLSPAPISGSASPRRRTATVNDEETFLARLEVS